MIVEGPSEAFLLVSYRINSFARLTSDNQTHRSRGLNRPGSHLTLVTGCYGNQNTGGWASGI